MNVSLFQNSKNQGPWEFYKHYDKGEFGLGLFLWADLRVPYVM